MTAGKGVIAPVCPTSYEFKVPEGAPLTLYPSVGTVKPGEVRGLIIKYYQKAVSGTHLRCKISVNMYPIKHDSYLHIKKQSFKLDTDCIHIEHFVCFRSQTPSTIFYPWRSLLFCVLNKTFS